MIGIYQYGERCMSAATRRDERNGYLRVFGCLFIIIIIKRSRSGHLPFSVRNPVARGIGLNPAIAPCPYSRRSCQFADCALQTVLDDLGHHRHYVLQPKPGDVGTLIDLPIADRVK